jgi:hypothetical protein
MLRTEWVHAAAHCPPHLQAEEKSVSPGGGDVIMYRWRGLSDHGALRAPRASARDEGEVQLHDQASGIERYDASSPCTALSCALDSGELLCLGAFFIPPLRLCRVCPHADVVKTIRTHGGADDEN